MTKPTKLHVRTAKTQISLGFRPVWSESSLSAWRKLGSLITHWALSEDSYQTGRMPRLIWVFAGRTVVLLVLSWGGLFVNFITFVCLRTFNFCGKLQRSSNENSSVAFFLCSYFPPVWRRTTIWWNVCRSIGIIWMRIVLQNENIPVQGHAFAYRMPSTNSLTQDLVLGQTFLFADLRESLPYDFSPSRKIKLLFWILIFLFCQPSIFLG